MFSSVIWKESFPFFFFDHQELNLFHFPHQIWETSQVFIPFQISWKPPANGLGAEDILPDSKIYKSQSLLLRQNRLWEIRNGILLHLWRICKDWLSLDKEPGLVGSQYIWDNTGEILNVGCTYEYARASPATDPRATSPFLDRKASLRPPILVQSSEFHHLGISERS